MAGEAKQPNEIALTSRITTSTTSQSEEAIQMQRTKQEECLAEWRALPEQDGAVQYPENSSPH